MELQFNTESLSCQKQVLHEVQNQEQTQEIRLPDGMPDVGRVISAWTQPVVRSKEWRADHIAMSGGVMVWVLYAPEDGTQERWVESWIPFQMKWDMPASGSDGVIRICCHPRFVDARVVSARKLMVRAGVSATAEALSPMDVQISTPGEVPEDVELLTNSYPLRLIREAGEKEFSLDEDLTLPAACPAAEKIMSYHVCPEITEHRVSGDKVIFRGNTNLHVLYRSEEGKLHACDIVHPFSQLTQLERTYSTDAQSDVALCVTSLEVTLEDEGNLRLKCGLVGQYRVDERQTVSLVEDAYSPVREVALHSDELKLPAILETREEILPVEQVMEQAEGSVVESLMYCDQLRQMRSAEQVSIELSGQSCALYYRDDGTLHASASRWERNFTLETDDGCELDVTVQSCACPQSGITADGITIKGDCSVDINARATSGLAMVNGLTLGDPAEPDPARPSVILCRVGERSLWQIAKESGSTVAAIRRANRLEGEPDQGKMLLIPVG